jgi:endonuclease III
MESNVIQSKSQSKTAGECFKAPSAAHNTTRLADETAGSSGSSMESSLTQLKGQGADNQPAVGGAEVLNSTEFSTDKASKKRKSGVINGEVVKGGWDQLPHNMGSLASKSAEDSPQAAATDKLSAPSKTRASRKKNVTSTSIPIKDEVKVDLGDNDKLGMPSETPIQGNGRVKTKAPRKRASRKENVTSTSIPIKDEVKVDLGDNDKLGKPSETPIQGNDQVATKASKKRASRAKPKVEKQEISDTPGETKDEETLAPAKPSDSNIEDKKANGKKSPTAKKVGTSTKRSRQQEGDESDFQDEKPKKKRASKASKAKKIDISQDVQHQVDKLIEAAETPTVKKAKKTTYGITPGISPYPDFSMPTAEACLEVNRLLSEEHGVVEQPKTIPPPSLEVTGCGEVPSVLDALIRTRLSAATTGTNSAYAFAGLVQKFGILEEGIGKGSVNWNKVLEADVKVIEQAIKRGGLAAMKSKSIKEILKMVHDQNVARREAFVKEKETGEKADVVGAETLQQGQKDLEIAAADQDILSLQFMHGLTPDEAMTELTKYPGIGVKTASCVILFCLRRPSFAVDTHVFRFCKWLKWIPENATRDKTFSHCEVRVPGELKYSLHQLFIRHGKTCGRCRASTGETSEVWKETICPIEHLVERTGKRKMFKPSAQLKKSKKKSSDDDDDSELSEVDEALFDEDENDNEATPESKRARDEE